MDGLRLLLFCGKVGFLQDSFGSLGAVEIFDLEGLFEADASGFPCRIFFAASMLLRCLTWKVCLRLM